MFLILFRNHQLDILISTNFSRMTFRRALVVCCYQCQSPHRKRIFCCDRDQICQFSKLMRKSIARETLRRGRWSSIYPVESMKDVGLDVIHHASRE